MCDSLFPCIRWEAMCTLPRFRQSMMSGLRFVWTKPENASFFLRFTPCSNLWLHSGLMAPWLTVTSPGSFTRLHKMAWRWWGLLLRSFFLSISSQSATSLSTSFTWVTSLLTLSLYCKLVSNYFPMHLIGLLVVKGVSSFCTRRVILLSRSVSWWSEVWPLRPCVT